MNLTHRRALFTMTSILRLGKKCSAFLYRNNFFNPKHSYVYLVDEDDFMCTKVVVNMSQMFRENGILYALLERSFKDDDCQVFKDIFAQYAPYSVGVAC